jgi:hypothetical protein
MIGWWLDRIQYIFERKCWYLSLRDKQCLSLYVEIGTNHLVCAKRA